MQHFHVRIVPFVLGASLMAPLGLERAATRAIAAGASAAEKLDRLSRTLALPPGARIEVTATVGEVSITGWDRPDVSVDIVRRAPTEQDLARFPARIEEDASSVRISATQLEEGKDASLRSTIAVSAPSSASFGAVRVFEGRIALSNVRGAINADIRRGAITASAIAGTVRLETGLGDIEVRRAELTPGGLIKLRTFNGNVALQLAAVPADARILALALAGTIRSEVPLAMKDRFGPRFGEATLGKGEPLISIDVVKGDIRITTK